MVTKFVFNAADLTRIVAWTCTIAVPVGPGKVDVQEIEARFRMVDPDVLAEEMAPAKLTGRGANSVLLEQVLDGFNGLKDATGKEVPDSDAIPLMRKLPYAAAGLAQGYFDMLAGRLPKN